MYKIHLALQVEQFSWVLEDCDVSCDVNKAVIDDKHTG